MRLESFFGGFAKLWVPFWGPYNKDPNILGSILGSLDFGKLSFITPINHKWKGLGFRILGLGFRI